MSRNITDKGQASEEMGGGKLVGFSSTGFQIIHTQHLRVGARGEYIMERQQLWNFVLLCDLCCFLTFQISIPRACCAGFAWQGFVRGWAIGVAPVGAKRGSKKSPAQQHLQPGHWDYANNCRQQVEWRGRGAGGAQVPEQNCTCGKGPTVEKLGKNCSLWGELSEILWDGPMLEQGEQCQESYPKEEGAAEATCDKLTTVTIPHAPALLGREEVEKI